ncbi:MAG: hypothetical protein JO019_04180 [Candidatus Kaiserbacteria bacterium]|nr:hypothetical protein [Candidatus Kaiserbacteria bacterium]
MYQEGIIIRIVRKIAHALGSLALLAVFVSAIIFVIVFTYKDEACGAGTFPPYVATPTPRLQLAEAQDYIRSEETTFITFPEWYIVYSAREYAAYVSDGNRPSHFPYFRSIAQFWCGYGAVHSYTKVAYPKDFYGNLEIFTIGASFSVQNLLQGVYENTIGRVSEFFAFDETTPEDVFAQKTAVDYAAFLDVTPWYRYPFFGKIDELWKTVPARGPHMVRKWERRFYLTALYSVEGLWSKVIAKATGDIYAPATVQEKMLVAAPLPPTLASDTRIRIDKDLGDDTAIIIVPRYQEFTDIVEKFAAAHAPILDIAGTRQILTTAFSPAAMHYDLPGTLLFTEQVLTDPARERLGIVVPVSDLETWVRAASSSGLTIEHIYDF